VISDAYIRKTQETKINSYCIKFTSLYQVDLDVAQNCRLMESDLMLCGTQLPPQHWCII